MNDTLRKNVSYAFAAQSVSLLVGCVTNLVLPRILGATDFSYWQLFCFYATYVPCLALGLNDGVYLRWGGKDRARMDLAALKSQLVVGMVLQAGLASLAGAAVLAAVGDPARKWVLLAVLAYFLVYSCHNYLGYLFQASNETDVYSRSLILNKLFYLAAQILLLALGAAGVFVLIPFYILSYGLALGYLLARIRPDFAGVTCSLTTGLAECRRSVRTGFSLMVSNICAMLVLGAGRQLIDLRWGVLAFGRVSFSLTLINFALTFISQLSMVLFPALRRAQDGQLAGVYQTMERRLDLLLPLIYLFYFPGRWLLTLWLPEYEESIAWLPLVLPICYFDCKMNLMGSTFFKVMNRQNQLLRINGATIGVSLALGLLGAYVFNSMEFVIGGMVTAVILRSTAADWAVRKALGIPDCRYRVQDIALAALFLGAGRWTPWWCAMLLIALAAGARAVSLRRCRA